MTDQTADTLSEPEAEPTFTLFRFCAKHRLRLDNRERSALGVELAKLAQERGIPVKRVREGVGSGEWSKSRVYPESFLVEWLIRYRREKRAAAKAQPCPQPTAEG